MTNDRFSLGVGVSPWPEDYVITETPFEGRGRRMDESIEIIRGLLRGGYYAFHGDHFDVPSIKITPVPAAPVPILVGGHSEAALRRAARLATAGCTAAATRRSPRLARSTRRAPRRGGTFRAAFEVHVISVDAYTLDGVRRLEEQGVTDVIVGFRGP